MNSLASDDMKKRILIVGDDERQRDLIRQAIATSKCNDGVIIVAEKEEEPVKEYNEAMALIAAFSGNAIDHEVNRLKRKAYRPTKQCLECGADHKHNNSWCSAECCKAWLLKKKKL